MDRESNAVEEAVTSANDIFFLFSWTCALGEVALPAPRPAAKQPLHSADHDKAKSEVCRYFHGAAVVSPSLFAASGHQRFDAGLAVGTGHDAGAVAGAGGGFLGKEDEVEGCRIFVDPVIH